MHVHLQLLDVGLVIERALVVLHDVVGVLQDLACIGGVVLLSLRDRVVKLDDLHAERLNRNDLV